MHDLPRLARAEHLPDLSPSTYPGARALRRVRLAEDMGRQFERNLSDEIVFRGFFRACPAGGR